MITTIGIIIWLIGFIILYIYGITQITKGDNEKYYIFINQEFYIKRWFYNFLILFWPLIFILFVFLFIKNEVKNLFKWK